MSSVSSDHCINNQRRSLSVAVCIKQVPFTEDASFDYQNNKLCRSGRNTINAFDLRAIALAVKLKTDLSAETVVVTMGPAQARLAIEEALAMGIARGVHLSDPAFAGADTLATARTLCAWLQTEEVDLILVGRHSLDAETGHVGPQLAELLGIPHIGNVRSIDFGDTGIVAERETDYGFDEVECSFPLLVTCAERLIPPIKLNESERRHQSIAAVVSMTGSDLGLDGGKVGDAGSPTKVGRIRVLEKKQRLGRLCLAPPREAATAIMTLVEKATSVPCVSPPPTIGSTVRNVSAGCDIWVVCETRPNGDLTPATLELASRGAAIANERGAALVALAIGRDAGHHKDTLASFGVDQILLVDARSSEAYCAQALTNLISAAIEEYSPWAILVPATEKGRDWAPRVAARLGLGLIGDAVDVELDESTGQLVALKPGLSGGVLAEIRSITVPQMVTVRPGMLREATPVNGREASFKAFRSPASIVRCRVKASHTFIDPTVTQLERASVVLGVGMGVDGPDGIARIVELARRLGAALCCTRKVADHGWLPRQLQVGLTGKGLRARLYVGFGVAGSPNHTVGLRNVETVIAINRDANAPFFHDADLAVVGECEPLSQELLALVGVTRVPTFAGAANRRCGMRT